MRLLIAGIGLIGRRHLEHALQMPEVDVVGVIDPAPLNVSVPQFTMIEEVDVAADAILIATPSHLHADHAEAAAKRGWHMLIEKPLAHDLAAADRIIAASAAANVQVLVGHHRRFHPKVVALKDNLAKIGRPLTATLIWALRKPDAYFDVPWRAGADGSPVMINLVHEIDTLRHLFGEIDEIAGLGAQQCREAGRVESGGALLRFTCGLIATISFSDAAASPWAFEAGTAENPNIAATGQDMLWITGTEGALSFPSLSLWSGSEDWSDPATRQKLVAGEEVPLIAQLRHLSQVVAGQTAPRTNAQDGRATLAATLKIEDAVEVTGRDT